MIDTSPHHKRQHVHDCSCPGSRTGPIVPGTLRWFWRVLSRPSECCEDGGYDSPSRFTTTSRVVCLRCLRTWRTKARYAEQLREPSPEELAQVEAGRKQDGHLPVIVNEDLAARAEARQRQVDYKMRAAGEA